MRKYERVNLASDIYKQKSTSRSPIALKKVQSSQLQSNKKEYQNVCCPSCRYLFKIQKQNQKPKTPFLRTNNQGSQESKDQTHLNKQTQTQQYMVVSIKTSPKKEKIERSWGSQLMKDNPSTDRIPQRAPHFDIKPVQYDRAMATDRKQRERNEGSYDISPKKELPNKQNQKISNLISKSKQREQFPVRSAYLNSKVEKSKQKNSRSMVQRREDVETYKKSIQVGSELKSKIARQLVSKIQLTQQINQIIQYHMNLRSQQLSVPSYCKMLIYDIQDRKQSQNQKQKQRISVEQNKKYADDEFYYARVTQLKSRYSKDKDVSLKY